MEKSELLKPDLFDQEKYDEHKVEESAEILLKAEEIKKDPVLMKNIKAHLDKKEKKIRNLKDLKATASEFSRNNKSEDDED